MKKVGAYIRVSTEEQAINGNGIELQKQALLAYVNSQGFQLNEKHIFIDQGKSGAYKENRPALYDLFQSAKNKEFDVVLVWKIDRFFRKTSYLLEGIEALSKMGVGFISTTQNINTTDTTGKLTLTILGGISEMERENIKERTYSGIMISMKKGKLGRGKPVYGYRKNKDGFLMIDDEEAKVIKMIYSMLNKEGKNIHQICEKLNNMNVATSCSKGEYGEKRLQLIKHKNLWHRSTVHNILRNEIYTGKLIQNRFTKDKITGKTVEKPESEWIIGECPKLITKKSFDKAQLSLQNNLKFAKKNTRKGETYMLAKLIKCGVTGYKFKGYKCGKGTKNYRISVDKTKVSNFNNLKIKGISALKLETAVWDKLKLLLQNPNVLENELILRIKSGENQEKEIRRKISILDENLIKLSNNTKGLFKLVTGLDDDSVTMVQEEIRENNLKIEEIRKEKSILERELFGNNEIKSKVDNFRVVSNIVSQNLDNLDYETKAELCKLFIKEIILDGSEVVINLIVPISPKNKALLKTDIVKDFFNENKEFIATKFKSITYDVSNGLKMLENIRTYFYQ